MVDPSKIIVALDLTDRKRLLELCDILAPHVGIFKIGSVAFSAFGPELVKEVCKRGPVFLDLKFHDIPNTVAGAVTAASQLGVSLMTIHASGGKRMIEAAAESASKVAGHRPKILAVTVLTHLSEDEVGGLGWSRTVDEQVVALAKLAIESGADGVVCSPLEVERLRSELGEDALLVVPGVRPTWAESGDQRRVRTPVETIAAGASLLVIGRPIVQAVDPVAAAKRIIEEA